MALLASIVLSDDGAVATQTVEDNNNTRTVASTVAMRSGCHFAHFTMVEGNDVLFGVLRPGWDMEARVNAFEVDGHCFCWTRTGSCYPGKRGWKGQQTAREQGDRIGMLLDLDQGSMTVWKNDEKLGVMQAEGLSGQEWSALLGDANFCRLFKLAHRCRAGAGVADGGGAGGGKGMGAPKPAGVAANGDRRRVRGNGTSMGGPGSSIAN